LLRDGPAADVVWTDDQCFMIVAYEEEASLFLIPELGNHDISQFDG